MANPTQPEPDSDRLGHAALTNLIRTLAGIIEPQRLSDGQRAGLANALTRSRRQLPEIYSACNLDALAARLQPRPKP